MLAGACNRLARGPRAKSGEVETGRQLKQNLMGLENCEPTLETVPAKAPPGTSYCGLSFPRAGAVSLPCGIKVRASRKLARGQAKWKLKEDAN
jgi:hypothetical protein